MTVYESIYKTYGLSPSQQKIIDLVGKDKNILEIGSSSGYMTNFFLDNNCSVDVVEIESPALKKVSNKVKKINKSIEDNSIVGLLGRDYDFIVMADVIEHLARPEKALENLKKVAGKDTRLIISTPNIACWPARKNLFFKGYFEYQESGILDKNHLHLFTVNSLPKLLGFYGWRVEQIIGSSTRIPLESLIGKIPFLKGLIAAQLKNLCFVHFITVASI